MSKTGPLASEKNLAESKKRDKLVDLQASEDLKWLLNQPQFRRWAIGLVFHHCMVNKMIFRPNSEMAFLEGRRSVAVDVLKTFTNFPELYSRFEHERVEAELDSLERARIRSSTEGDE